jgi:hypothetical protein
MKQVLLLIFVFMISFTLKAQIKPTAMLLPIYFVDLDKKSLQGSLNNFVKTELSNYYDLKSEKEVEQARDAAVDQISSENCTEEACVKVMGELLDVEYTFSLEIIDTGEGWDLSVVRQDMDRVTSRRNELCNECSLSKARKSLAGILTALRPGEMLIQRGKASLRLESTPRSQVFLDGREQGKTPLDLSVNARVPLEIFMVAEGYNDFAEEFILKPGEKRKKHAKLTRKRGNIRITSNPPKASIYVDGILEMDDQDKDLLTPADLRLVYGQHELKLQLEKYEVATKILKINKKNLGTKNITLKPKPGRLIVRVPSEHKQARIMLDDNYFGSMNGSIVSNFEVPANVRYSLRAEDGNFKSETKTIRIEPDGSGRVGFEDFTETKITPFKLPDWSGADLSLLLLYDSKTAELKVSSEKVVKLIYSLLGIGFQWKSFKFEGYGGDGSMEVDDKASKSFFFSDGSKIHEVTSTSASITRLMYASALPEKYGQNGSWIWGAGFEWVTLTLRTKYAGIRTIKTSGPIIGGGYQYHWSEYYFNIEYQISSPTGYSNFTIVDGINFGLGYVW